jgi:hypothetical protein
LNSRAPAPQFDAAAATTRARELADRTLVQPLTAARRDRMLFTRAALPRPLPAVTVELDPATGPVVTGAIHRGLPGAAPERVRIDTRTGQVTVTSGDRPAVPAAEYVAPPR